MKRRAVEWGIAAESQSNGAGAFSRQNAGVDKRGENKRRRINKGKKAESELLAELRMLMEGEREEILSGRWIEGRVQRVEEENGWRRGK